MKSQAWRKTGGGRGHYKVSDGVDGYEFSICFYAEHTNFSPNDKLSKWACIASSDLQHHYSNRVFGNVYLLALDNTKVRGKHCWTPISVMGVVDRLGHGSQ